LEQNLIDVFVAATTVLDASPFVDAPSLAEVPPEVIAVRFQRARAAECRTAGDEPRNIAERKAADLPAGADGMDAHARPLK
jgi:hypothetical protein